jgi:hypothetical protein
LIDRIRDDLPVPSVLNVATPGPVCMGDILDAAQIGWDYGPPAASARPRVTMSVAKLGRLMPLPAMTAQQMVADWRETRAWANAT